MEYLFDFYNLLVENLFGSVFLSIIGVGVVLVLMLFFLKTSGYLIINWLTFYAIVTMTLYFGAFGYVVASLLSFSMFIYQVFRLFARTEN